MKTWNPRPEIPDEPCEDLPDWMDDVCNLGPRVVKSVDKIETEVQEALRNITIKPEAEAQKREANFVMPKAVKINSKPWSSKDTSAKSKASQGKTPHHDVSVSSNKRQTSSSEAQITEEIPKAMPERCAKDTNNLATCDISPPVEEYFSKDKPEIQKESKAGKSKKIPGVDLDLPVAPVDSKVKSNKKKKGNKNSETPEVQPSKVEPIISESSAKEAAAEEKESVKPKRDAKSASNADVAISSVEGKIKSSVKTKMELTVDESLKEEKTRKKVKKEIEESTTEHRREFNAPVAASQAANTLKIKPSKEATPQPETATEEMSVEQSRKKKGKEKRGPKNDDNSTADFTAKAHTKEMTPECEVAVEEIPADKSKKSKEKIWSENDDNSTVGVLSAVKPSREGTPEAAAEEIPTERSKKKKGKERREPESDENSTVGVYTEMKPSREATPESEATVEEIPVDNSKKKRNKERRGTESDSTEVKSSREATPEIEAAAGAIPVERSKKKKSKERRLPESDENSPVDFTVGVHTEVRPSREVTPESEVAVEEIPVDSSKKKKSKERRETESDENSTEVKPSREVTPESEAAAEEFPVERSKKKKGKEKRGPESDENSAVDFTVRAFSEVKPIREATPESEAAVEEIPVERSKKKKGRGKRGPESSGNTTVAECTEIKLKTANKGGESGKTQEQKVISSAPVKTNPWGKPMEKKEPESDYKHNTANKDAEAGKTQEQKVTSPVPMKTNPWGKPMEKRETKINDKLKTENKNAEFGKTQEQSTVPVKTNPWGKPMKKQEPESDDKLKTANKDAESGKTQEQKVKSPAPVKTNPWGKPVEKKEPESDDNFSVDRPVSVARTEIKLKIASKNTEACKTQEQRVKPVDPVKTNPWSKSDGKGKEKRGPESDDNFSDYPLVSAARAEPKLEIPGKDTETRKTEEQNVKTVGPTKTNPWGKSDVTVSAKLQSRETSKEADTSIDVKTPSDPICVEAEETSATEAATHAKSEEKETGARVNDEMNESMASSQIGWNESSGRRGKGKKKRGKNKNGNNSGSTQSIIETQAKIEEQSPEKNEVQQGAAKRAVALEKHQERCG